MLIGATILVTPSPVGAGPLKRMTIPDAAVPAPLRE